MVNKKEKILSRGINTMKYIDSQQEKSVKDIPLSNVGTEKVTGAVSVDGQRGLRHTLPVDKNLIRDWMWRMTIIDKVRGDRILTIKEYAEIRDIFDVLMRQKKRQILSLIKDRIKIRTYTVPIDRHQINDVEAVSKTDLLIGLDNIFSEYYTTKQNSEEVKQESMQSEARHSSQA